MANGYVPSAPILVGVSSVADAPKKNSYSIIIGLVIVVIASVLAYFFSPKGETQTFVRTAVLWLLRVVAD